MKIHEIIVVEGRDDTAAIRRALDAETIETHGFGIREETWQEIETAAKTRGIIVFTDPDHAGLTIRRRVTERFPDAKQAYLPREEAIRRGDIGVENASPEAIREALRKARARLAEGKPVFTAEDLRKAGLTGGAGSRERRIRVARTLGIGYGNAKALLEKLNAFGITKEEFYGAIRSADDTLDHA